MKNSASAIDRHLKNERSHFAPRLSVFITSRIQLGSLKELGVSVHVKLAGCVWTVLRFRPVNGANFRSVSLLAEPLPLMDLCRRSVRLALGKNRLSEISTLPLPKSLKNYLLYQ